MSTASPTPPDRRAVPRRKAVLITGGAGFVGTNLAHALLDAGERVIVFDNLSRPGVEANLQWLRTQHDGALQVCVEDVRNRAALARVVREAKQVYHFAAQVAVTTSLVDPTMDFEVNAGGTLNVLEAIRAQSTPPSLVFTSTNKVYGHLPDLPLREVAGRYEPVCETTRARGIDESRPLEFCSPYGCSKGAADQYVLDYARVFGIAAVVFRMSCIYGPHQCGTEDQGWVAHFAARALDGAPLTIYGDGRQVRDVLHVADLVAALRLAHQHAPGIAGQAFNIGGGPSRTTSLLELLDRLAAATGQPLRVAHEDWRPGDQRYYVSNTARFEHATGWRPRFDVDTGLRDLVQWLSRRERTSATQAERMAS